MVNLPVSPKRAIEEHSQGQPPDPCRECGLPLQQKKAGNFISVEFHPGSDLPGLGLKSKFVFFSNAFLAPNDVLYKQINPAVSTKNMV